jgi:hypothetical protein
MKEELTLYGTYDELKKWYDSLEIKQRDDPSITNYTNCNTEFMTFNNQLDKNEIGKFKIICWFETEIDDLKNIKFILKSKKVCLVYDIDNKKII